MQNYDILIVGAGPIGIACGIEAKKRGLSYLIVEKGCLVNSLYRYPINMKFFSSSRLLELDGIPFISVENKPSRNEALEYYRRIAIDANLNINLFEEVLKVNKQSDIFTVKTNKDTYNAANVIIATGFYDIPNMLNIPGEELPKLSHYYNDPHYYSGMDLVVVGASNSSVDAALECYRKGARVTMVVRDATISSHVKYWVRPDIENRISEGSIKVYFKSQLTEIGEGYVKMETPEGNIKIKNDFVLALTGYRPNFEFLNQIGVNLSDEAMKTPVYNDDTMETNVENLYLAGVVCGGLNTHLWFIENSRVHAKKIIENITLKSCS